MTGWARWRLGSGKGYEEAKSEIDDADLGFITRYALWEESITPERDDEQSPGMYAAYKDPVMQFLHARLWPRMEEITDLTLMPTYTYVRVYRPGAILEKHKDRPACEVSATLLVGANYSPTWPLFIEGEQIVQEPGELAVYRGGEVDHWREPMTGPENAYHVQLFIHYVDANGPYTMCVNDADRP
jgi:hypothetical protein